MIGVPFDNNDLTCLGSITELVAEVVADLVARRDPLIVEIAERYPTTGELAAWIRTLPQRDDDGDPADGPKVEACEPMQRLRIPAPDPNCVERAALYLAVAELIDPQPVRQLATLDFTFGRHTFPIENGAPIILDPDVPADEIAAVVAAKQSRNAMRAVPVVLAIDEAIAYVGDLAEDGAATVRNGAARVRGARNAIRELVERGVVPTEAHEADAIGWFFAQAEAVARQYGTRALAVVQTTAKAIGELVDALATQPQAQRNLGIEIGGETFKIPSWVSGLGKLVGRVGLDLGAVALRPKLGALGITGEMVGLVEHELNREGLSLGPLARSGQAFFSPLSSITNNTRAS